MLFTYRVKNLNEQEKQILKLRGIWDGHSETFNLSLDSRRAAFIKSGQTSARKMKEILLNEKLA